MPGLKISWEGREEALRRVDELSYEIVGSRKGTYQDNWALMGLNSLLSGAMYKCDRARFTSDPGKRLDDVLDAMNYLRFTAVRLLEERRDG